MVARALAKVSRGQGRLYDDLLIMLAVGAVIAVCSAALASVGVSPHRPIQYFYNTQPYFLCLLILAVVHMFYGFWRDKPDSPLRYLREVEFSPGAIRHILVSLPIVGAVIALMPTFSAMKSSIDLFSSYGWDRSFIDLDRAMHGTDAWRLLQPVFGYPVVTSALSVAYHLWFFLIFMGTVYFAVYVKDRTLRRRLLASYFATWSIIGIFMAIAFASVGPCFVGPILGDHTFDGQMAYLRHADTQYEVLSMNVQRILLEWHYRDSTEIGRGISAMPSMHVALAFLFFLAMRKVSKAAGWFFGAFFVVIFLASVHLAYHYAADGYVAVIVTAIIWKTAGLWRSPQ